MKTKILLVALLFVGVFYSCKKDDKDNAPSTTPLAFTSFSVQDSVAQIDLGTGEATFVLSALATGDGLTYTWTHNSPVGGVFSGSGANMTWSICHVSKFKITCTVKDKNNASISKDIYVRSEN